MRRIFELEKILEKKLTKVEEDFFLIGYHYGVIDGVEKAQEIINRK